MIAKRIFDLFFTVPGILVLMPLMLLVAVWIKFDSKGPVIFRQQRVGLNGCLFDVLKFRSMVVNAEDIGPKVTSDGDPRITSSGAFIRKYKLDELPQLLNVLKGDMSLVGPRPEVPEYVAHYPEKVKDLVLSVPPGITDYAAIEFRDENQILEHAKDPQKTYLEEILPIKLGLYETYIQNRSLWLDFSLVLKTLLSIAEKR